MQADFDLIAELETISRQRALTDAEIVALSIALRHDDRRPRPRSAWYTHWTPKDDRIILKAADRRVRATDIAEMLGRTPWAIRTRLYALRKASGVNVRAARKRARLGVEA